jgi:hypothetical protein
MSKFLVRILYLLSAVVLTNLLFHKFVEYPRNNYKDEVKKSNIYVLGDSHAAAFLNDQKELLFYNFSYGSDNLIDMYRKIKYLIDEKLLIKSDTVLLEIDLHVFSKYRNVSNNNDISGVYTNSLSSSLKYYFPLFGETKLYNIKRMLFGLNERDKRDYVLLKTASDSIIFKNRFQRQYGDEFNLQPYYLKMLKLITELCEENEIVLIGIHYPLHPYYNKLFSNKYDFNDYMDSIKIGLKSNIILDYSRSMVGDSNFFDQDHISKKGSKKLGNLLMKDLKYQ